MLIDTEKWLFMCENLIEGKPFLLDKEQTFALNLQLQRIWWAGGQNQLSATAVFPPFTRMSTQCRCGYPQRHFYWLAVIGWVLMIGQLLL